MKMNGQLKYGNLDELLLRVDYRDNHDVFKSS